MAKSQALRDKPYEELREQVESALEDLLTDLLKAAQEAHAARAHLKLIEPRYSVALSTELETIAEQGKVGTTSHRRKIRFPFARPQWQTSQLPIHQVKAKILLFRFRQLDVILGDLVTKAARTTVNGHHDLADLIDVEGTGRLWIIDLIDHLYFTKMIARSQAAELFYAPLDGRIRYGIRISTRESAMLFSDFEILRRAITLFDSPGGSAHHHSAYLIDTQLAHACPTDTRWQVVKKFIGELLGFPTNLLI